MTIERLFEMNGHHGGFWVQHRTWQNLCARIDKIARERGGGGGGGAGGGGEAKKHDSSAEAAAASFAASGFDVRSGRRLKLGEWPDDSHYVQIAQPPWHREIPSCTSAGGPIC